MNIFFNPELLRCNPSKTFKFFARKVQQAISQGEPVNDSVFTHSLREIGDTLVSNNERHVFNYKSYGLAYDLEQKKEFNLAAIIYGYILKYNKNNPFIYEQTAKKALDMAKKNDDPIHVMARAYDLSFFYRKTDYGSAKHLQALLTTEEALEYIVKNYNLAIKKYHTVSRQALPPDNYEIMLCIIKLEIAKLQRNQSMPLMAIQKLEEASDIIGKYGEGTLTNVIRNLNDEIYSKL